MAVLDTAIFVAVRKEDARIKSGQDERRGNHKDFQLASFIASASVRSTDTSCDTPRSIMVTP